MRSRVKDEQKTNVYTIEVETVDEVTETNVYNGLEVCRIDGDGQIGTVVGFRYGGVSGYTNMPTQDIGDYVGLEKYQVKVLWPGNVTSSEYMQPSSSTDTQARGVKCTLMKAPDDEEPPPRPPETPDMNIEMQDSFTITFPEFPQQPRFEPLAQNGNSGTFNFDSFWQTTEAMVGDDEDEQAPPTAPDWLIAEATASPDNLFPPPPPPDPFTPITPPPMPGMTPDVGEAPPIPNTVQPNPPLERTASAPIQAPPPRRRNQLMLPTNRSTQPQRPKSPGRGPARE